ncbi:MAG: hypothetical protein IPN34_21790 [Planctomycetes bacterium]|nr:hypothetical protein [Planctomycetota bacterium]
MIKLLNNTGQNLWYSSGGPGRTKWAPNTVWEHNVGDGDVMPCSGTAWYSIDFYNASSGGTVVYSYVVRCSKCQ